MIGAIGMTVVVAMIFAFIIGVYTVLGIVIYKDAKAYEMPAAMWTAVALLVPNMIGVIIYLVVRSSKEKNVYCSNCNTKVEKDYNICPKCKGVFEEVCQVCNKAIKEEQMICPYCGSEALKEVSTKTATKVCKKSNIAKPLIIIGVIYFVFIFVLLFSVIGLGATSYVENITMENVKLNGISTGISTISIDTSTKKKIKHTFHYTTEVKTRKLNVYADEVPQIDINITLEGGAIELEILDENENVVFEKVYEGSIDESGNGGQSIDAVPLQITEDKVYTLKFIYREAKKGSIEIAG